MKGITLGYGLCGSFCTLGRSVEALRELAKRDIKIIPIMSEIVYTTDTRFGKAKDFIEEIEDICKNEIIHTIKGAEPIGPKGLLDILVVAPCTGNTLAKTALGITDTSVTMAIKAHLRGAKPVVLGISTNDALGGSAKNIGLLQNTKNIYFVPYGQDNAEKKPNSLVCDFGKIEDTVLSALEGKQIEPIFTV
ncbi:MAG: dipicolinate synthase subunit B [Clostridia bacterium]|nr:dipicolinate synthase subunit B [Clostridia bacterium]